MSAFTKVGKASASAATSAIKSVGKDLSTNALVQSLSGKKGRINYRSLSRSPSPLPSISSPVSYNSTPYLKPVTPVYSRSSSIASLNNLNLNEYNNTQDTIFKPIKAIKSNRNTLYGGKLKATRKNLSQRRPGVKKTKKGLKCRQTSVKKTRKQK